MTPNDQYAIDAENEGINDVEDNIDYDEIYGGLDVDTSSYQPSKKMESSFKSILGDIVGHGAKEFLIGVGGAYGDLAELAGLNPEQLPGQKVRREAEYDVLQRMEQEGYKPSARELMALSSEDDLALENFKLPTSQDIRGGAEAIGAPGEAKTAAGRYAGRTGRLYGSGLAFGQVNPIPAVAGGALGQTVEEMGGGPLAQSAAEIAGLLLGPGGAKNVLASSKKDVQNKINALRNAGYTDEQITLAINSAASKSKVAKFASKGEKTEEAFKDFATKSDEIVNDILSSAVPGLEKGMEEVHSLASSAYDKVAQAGSQITITKPKPFVDATKRVTRQLENTLGTNQEAQPFIKRLSEAADAANKNPTADTMINFYKELNSLGKWMGRNQKDRLITEVKNGIVETFKNEGATGKTLANEFEKVNKGVRKAYQAEDLIKVVDKSKTQDGIDYSKLRKVFDKKENVKLMDDVLGKQSTDNLRLIANTGKEVKDFDKSWKAANNLSQAAKIGESSLALYYLYKGDWDGLTKLAATKAGIGVARKIAEKSLTDPRFQNLMIRGLHAIKQRSPRLMTSANNALNKYLDEEGLSIEYGAE